MYVHVAYIFVAFYICGAIVLANKDYLRVTTITRYKNGSKIVHLSIISSLTSARNNRINNLRHPSKSISYNLLVCMLIYR